MRHIVILSGSGISKESGIPTFRDSDGLWNNFNVEDVATIEGYRRNRELVINFYNDCRRQMNECVPNEAHKIIAELEKDPDYIVTVITQNVDNLHEKAGSTNVIHLHGEINKATSSMKPNDENCIIDITDDIKIGDKANDGSQLRPYIVWFGENVPNYKKAEQIMHMTDICIIIGTSLQVYPAAGLVFEVPSNKHIYIIDPNDVNVDEQGLFEVCPITHIKKTASEGMKEFLNILKNENN